MYVRNTEPTVEELLDDPIAHLLMTSDRLQAEQVWAFVNDARRRLKDREAPHREVT
jgi:hypothetical protein